VILPCHPESCRITPCSAARRWQRLPRRRFGRWSRRYSHRCSEWEGNVRKDPSAGYSVASSASALSRATATLGGTPRTTSTLIVDRPAQDPSCASRVRSTGGNGRKSSIAMPVLRSPSNSSTLVDPAFAHGSSPQPHATAARPRTTRNATPRMATIMPRPAHNENRPRAHTASRGSQSGRVSGSDPASRALLHRGKGSGRETPVRNSHREEQQPGARHASRLASRRRPRVEPSGRSSELLSQIPDRSRRRRRRRSPGIGTPIRDFTR